MPTVCGAEIEGDEVLDKVAGYLRALIADARSGAPVAGNPFANEAVQVITYSVPDSKTRTVPKMPTIRVKNGGGPPRMGFLGLVRSRVDIDAISTPYPRAGLLAKRVRLALERAGQRTKFPELVPLSTNAGVRIARREDGPYQLEDEQFRWPTIWGSFIVDTYNT